MAKSQNLGGTTGNVNVAAFVRVGRFATFTKADGLPDEIVTRLDKDREGNIWLGTPQGVGRYARGSFTKFTTHEGLPEHTITARRSSAGLSTWND